MGDCAGARWDESVIAGEYTWAWETTPGAVRGPNVTEADPSLSSLANPSDGSTQTKSESNTPAVTWWLRIERSSVSNQGVVDKPHAGYIP